MKNKLLLLLTFIANLCFASVDVSFATNTWIIDAGATMTSNEIIITGDATKYFKETLVKTVDPTAKNLYFVAEVFMTGISGGPESYRWPKFKIYDNSTGLNILAYNLDLIIEGRWVTTGMVIENFDKKGVTEVKLEFGIQNCAGTMKIRNPQLTYSPPRSVYSFPFDVPADPACNLSIVTASTHPFQNDLLSTNNHFAWASYSWSDSEVIQTINDNFPMSTMRFPGGTIGNFYKYTTDGYYGDPYTFLNQSRENAFNAGFTFNYPGFKNLCIANSSSAILMFNVVQDDVNTAKARLQSRINDGINVSWIEMGNENFFSEQGLGNVNSLGNYISHTTALSAGLKTIDPTVKVAVNIEHDNYSSGSWNNELSKLSYFDAAVMHPYVNTNTFMLNDFAANVMFSAYKTTAERIANYTANFPGKPLLFSEWSILSSGTPVNFVQTLSLADMFIAIEKGNQDGVVKQAGIHMFYHSDKYGESTLSYHDGGKMVLTAAGVMYAELFNTFKNNTVYNAISTSTELSNGLPAVNAKAVLDGDSIRIFVVNKLPVASPLNLQIDGITANSSYRIKYFNEDPSKELTIPYATKEKPWISATGSGVPIVPAYSIAVVSFKQSDIITSNNEIKRRLKYLYPNPSANTVSIANHQGENWEITDASGKKIEIGNSSTINISNLTTGTYFLKIGTQSIKLIKQ